MISDQSNISSESNAQFSPPQLTVEESFFLELLEKREKNTINLKLTSKGVQLGNLEPFTNYYSESEILRLLESLVSKKMINKLEKGAVLLCPKCGGHANMPVLVCPRCGSTKVGRKEDLNHAECQYWGPREEFIDGVLLRCPRCDELLDEKALEGTPGYFSVSDPYFECQECGTAVSKNNLTMVCIKCSNKYTSVQAAYLNSVSYILAANAPEKMHTPPPKTIRERLEEEQKSEESAPTQEPEANSPIIEPEKTLQPTEKDTLVKSEPSRLTTAEKPGPEKADETEEKPEIRQKQEPQLKEKRTLKANEKISDPLPLQEETLDEPKEEITSKPIVESVVESVIKPKKEIKKEIITTIETQVTEPEPEQEPEAPPEVTPDIIEEQKPVREEKPKQDKPQSPLRMVSDLFKKKPKKKTTKKQKPKIEPEPEPEYEDEEDYHEEEPYLDEPQSVEVVNETEPHQILMIVENVTVSEFIIEALEGVKKPINVIHVDEGNLALKELRRKYDALIIDLDLKTINSKFILSEMEKWSIMTPIIAVSDDVQRLDKYILNVETVLKKKQGDIHKMRKILQKLL